MIFLYCERLVEFLLYIAYFINPVILINKSINECTCREILGERRVESIFCMYIGEINNNPMRSSCHLIITCLWDLERLVRSPNCLRIFPFSRLRQRADGGCNRSTEDALSFIACTDPTSIFLEVRVCSAPVWYFFCGFLIVEQFVITTCHGQRILRIKSALNWHKLLFSKDLTLKICSFIVTWSSWSEWGKYSVK